MTMYDPALAAHHLEETPEPAVDLDGLKSLFVRAFERGDFVHLAYLTLTWSERASDTSRALGFDERIALIELTSKARLALKKRDFGRPFCFQV